MAKLLKLRRGTTSQHSSFTGAEGEVTVDTDKETLVVHNGSTQAGFPLLRQDMSNLPGGTIDNADVSGSAAIAGTKISPNFGSQTIQTTGNIDISDSTNTNNNRIKIGAGNDLEIYHDGNNKFEGLNGYVKLAAINGSLFLDGNSTFIRSGDASEIQAEFNNGGAVELNHAGSKKLETTSSGVKITGTLTGDDNHGLLLGNSQDLRIRHTGSHSEITDEGDGNLRLGSNQTEIRTANLATLSAKFVGSGAVELNHAGTKMFETTSAGVLVSGTATTGQLIAKTSSEPQIVIQDSNSGNTGNAAETGLSFKDGGGTQQSLIGHHSSSDSDLYFDTTSTGLRMNFRVGGSTTQLEIRGGECNFDSDIILQSGHTVDGRDVAADGSKLDGIASGATNVTNNNQLTNGAGYITSVSGQNYNLLSNKPTIPTNNNQLTNGAGYITSASFSDVAGGGNFTGDVTFSGGTNAALIASNSDISFNNGNWTGNHTKIQQHASALYIVGGSSGIIFREGGNDRCQVDGSGHFIPGANNTYNLGSTSRRWSNIYTNDLHLSNEGSSNDVDSTWGDWTIQEGESDLFLKNNRSGKKYKFNLTEVS